MANKNMTLTLDEETFERYRTLAAKDGRSLAGWIRFQLAKAVESAG